MTLMTLTDTYSTLLFVIYEKKMKREKNDIVCFISLLIYTHSK